MQRLLAAACSLATFAASGSVRASAVAFTHVTVLDLRTGAAHPDQTVLVEGERITQAGPSGASPVPPGAVVVDGTGKFLLPGLWDMHVHSLWVPGGREVTLPLFLVNGVTGVRDMGTELSPILAARRDIARGSLPGPRLVVAGPMLDGPKSHYAAMIKVETAAEGRAAVEKLKRAGVDFIKVQSNLPRAGYFAVAEEARKQHLPLVGHVPDEVRASEAVEAGQQSFEHLIGVFEASSTAEDELLHGKKTPGKLLATFSPALEEKIIALLAARQVWQCPTLFWERGQWLVDAIDVGKDPDVQHAPRSWREKWPRSAQGILAELDTDPLPVREKFVAHELDLVRKLHEAGVPFLAGTDTAAGVGVMPGYSLHRELERLVAAGFSPLQALQTATINPARFLQRTADLGEVAPGKLADLVLLDANPLQDIRNTRRIAAVVANGRYLSREELARLLASADSFAQSH